MEAKWKITSYANGVTKDQYYPSKKIQFTQYDSKTGKIDFELFSDLKKPQTDISYCEFACQDSEGNDWHVYGDDQYEYEVNSNILTLTLPVGALTTAKKHTGRVIIYDGNFGRLTAVYFDYDVKEDITADKSIEQDGNYPILTDLISDVQAVISAGGTDAISLEVVQAHGTFGNIGDRFDDADTKMSNTNTYLSDIAVNQLLYSSLKTGIEAIKNNKQKLNLANRTYTLNQFIDLITTEMVGGFNQAVQYALNIVGDIEIIGDNATIIFDNTGISTYFACGLNVQGSLYLKGVNFKFADLANAKSGHLLKVSGTVDKKSKIVIEECSFTGGYEGIVLGDYADGGNIRRNVFDGTYMANGGYGILFNDSIWAKNIHIHHNQFLGSPTCDAIEINNDSATYKRSTSGNTENIFIHHNTIDGYTGAAPGGFGVGCAGKVKNVNVHDNEITNCRVPVHFENNQEFGQSEKIYVKDNELYGTLRAIEFNDYFTTTPATSYGVPGTNINPIASFLFDYINAVIEGNHIKTDATGISVAQNPGMTIKGNTIYRSLSRNFVKSGADSGIACNQSDSLVIEGNKIINFVYGIMNTGGLDPSSVKFIEKNYFIDCSYSYNLNGCSNLTAGSLVVKGNNHINAKNVYITGGDTVSLVASNETINGMTLDEVIYGNAGVPYGILYSKKTAACDFGNLGKLKDTANASDVFLKGHIIYNTAWVPGATKHKIVTGEGSIVTTLNTAVTATTVAGSNEVVVSSAAELIVGKIIQIVGSGLPNPTFIIKKDTINNKVWLSSNAVSAVSNASLTIQAAVTTDESYRRSYAGSPVGNLVPFFVGEECMNSLTGAWYKSKGLTNADWLVIS